MARKTKKEEVWLAGYLLKEADRSLTTESSHIGGPGYAGIGSIKLNVHEEDVERALQALEAD